MYRFCFTINGRLAYEVLADTLADAEQATWATNGGRVEDLDPWDAAELGWVEDAETGEEVAREDIPGEEHKACRACGSIVPTEAIDCFGNCYYTC